MSQYSRDPIVNVIQLQIKAPIKLCVQHGHLSAAIKLIFAGIDAMAFLAMPKTDKKGKPKENVEKGDFILWVEQYLQFEGNEQLTGLDVYGARCSMLHNHSVYSDLSRQGACREVGYASKKYPPIQYNPTISQQFVIVSVPALAEAFFDGIDTFLIDLFSNLEMGQIAKERLDKFVLSLPVIDKKDELS